MRPVRRPRRRRSRSVFGRLARALAVSRPARRLAATLLLVVLVCLGLAGWRGIGPLLAQAGTTQETSASDRQTTAGNADSPGSPGAGTSLQGGKIGAAFSGILGGLSSPTEAPAIVSLEPPLHCESQDDDILPGESVPFPHDPPGGGATGSTGADATGSTGAGATVSTGSPVVVPVPQSPEKFPGIADSVTRSWTFPMTYNASTPIVGVFGASRNDRLHAGIDLYAPQGTEIHAMTAGTVFNVEVFYQGLMTVDVANDDGTSIRYAELIPTVQAGEHVEAGQLIGRLKRNYDGTCMLHMEIYATVRPEPLTQIPNQADYPLVPVKPRSYRRRSDLVNPGAVYTLAQPEIAPN